QWRNLLALCGSGLSLIFFSWFFLKPSLPTALLGLAAIALLAGSTFFFAPDGALLLRRLMPLLFVAAILLPYIRLPGGIPDLRPELLMVIVAGGLLLLDHLATGHPLRFRPSPAYKWFAFFAFAILLSTVYASTFKGQPISGRDLWELMKLALYFLIFFLVASKELSPRELKRYYLLLLILLLLSALFGFMQYINFAGVNQFISPHYAPSQMQGLLVHKRITGTTPNPNEFGALLVLASSLALSGALFFQEGRMRLFCWIALPVYLFALILTLSRTALISLFVSFLLLLSLFFKKRGFKRSFMRLFIVILLGCLIGLVILQFTPAKAFTRFGELTMFTQATSWQARVQNWETHYSLWRSSPWFGWGPGKVDMGTVVDNEWLLLLRRYGVVGLSLFLSLFGSIYLGLSRIVKRSEEAPAVALAVALKSTLIAYMVYMALAVVYHSLQLMPILLLSLGLAYTRWPPGRREAGY
ncbi:MAG: O-antigen ligase family protein, partial [Firmicutes bacterium]|nr:O-antigen ligase family protein [Bacillota bacterium]